MGNLHADLSILLSIAAIAFFVLGSQLVWYKNYEEAIASFAMGLISAVISSAQLQGALLN